jgi:hypothetical protein
LWTTRFWNNPHQVLSVKRLEQSSSGTFSQKIGTILIRYFLSKDWNNPHLVLSVKRLESQIIERSMWAIKPKNIWGIWKLKKKYIVSTTSFVDIQHAHKFNLLSAICNNCHYLYLMKLFNISLNIILLWCVFYLYIYNSILTRIYQ